MREQGEQGEQGGRGRNNQCPMPNAPCPMPNFQIHTNILKEFGYLVRQFGIS
jgi:hypothetical protein